VHHDESGSCDGFHPACHVTHGIRCSGKKPQKAQLGDAKSSAAQPGIAKPTRGKTDTSNKMLQRSGTAGDADS